MRKIGLIILAAGESKRLDYFPKQLLEFNGKTLLRNAAENAVNSDSDLVCVVLGANAERLKNEIKDLSVEIIVNENWAEGMASSMQKGLQKLLEVEPKLQAVCLTLCDQPLINSQVINQIIHTFQTDDFPLVASEYAETIGVPAIFGESFFAELLNLKSSEGAKKVLVKNFALVKKIPVSEAAFDIDTKEDLESFLKQFRSSR